jgi:hypothetical protein
MEPDNAHGGGAILLPFVLNQNFRRLHDHEMRFSTSQDEMVEVRLHDYDHKGIVSDGAVAGNDLDQGAESQSDSGQIAQTIYGACFE